MNLWFLPFAFLIGFTAVNSGNGNTDQCLKPPFHGITETSADGTLTGRTDRGDWGCIDAVTGRVVETMSVPPVPPPTQICFFPAAPNPTSGAVRLEFTLPAESSVTLTIYGQTRGHGRPEAFVVKTLANSTMAPGRYEVTWDLTNSDGSRVPAGIYRAVLEVQGMVLCGDIEVQ